MQGCARCDYNMLKRGNAAGNWAVLLATCFCLFTLAQTARPLESIGLLLQPGVAAKYQQLTRHTLKEVGSRVADLFAGTTTEFGELTLEDPPRNSCLNRIDAPVRLVRAVVHRRIPPSAPDDAH